jgi:rhodanese-related sulfurtransferase
MRLIKNINVTQLSKAAQTKGVILDVRSHIEHQEAHLGFEHVHIPLDQLNPTDFMTQQGLSKDHEVYILCHSGQRARKAAQAFYNQGFENVYVVEGGLQACKQADYQILKNPCELGSPRIPLERQVRMGAGIMVLLGCLLTWLVHGFFLLIPLLVGMGLIYAGLTDRCGLGFVLSKAPWNQFKQKSGELSTKKIGCFSGSCFFQ